jgi:hypothetical protein
MPKLTHQAFFMPTLAKNRLSGYTIPEQSQKTPHASDFTGTSTMPAKALMLTLTLCVCFSVSEAQARPELTAEQLAKARQTAAQMKPPVDFDVLLEEADRLGVQCEGDLTRKGKIRVCMNYVEIAQSKERQAKIEERLKKKIDDLADKADKKLKQAK